MQDAIGQSETRSCVLELARSSSSFSLGRLASVVWDLQDLDFKGFRGLGFKGFRGLGFRGFRVFWGCRGFMGLGFRGFRGLGFKGFRGFRGLGGLGV